MLGDERIRKEAGNVAVAGEGPQFSPSRPQSLRVKPKEFPDGRTTTPHAADRNSLLKFSFALSRLSGTQQPLPPTASPPPAHRRRRETEEKAGEIWRTRGSHLLQPTLAGSAGTLNRLLGTSGGHPSRDWLDLPLVCTEGAGHKRRLVNDRVNLSQFFSSDSI